MLFRDARRAPNTDRVMSSINYQQTWQADTQQAHSTGEEKEMQRVESQNVAISVCSFSALRFGLEISFSTFSFSSVEKLLLVPFHVGETMKKKHYDRRAFTNMFASFQHAIEETSKLARVLLVNFNKSPLESLLGRRKS